MMKSYVGVTCYQYSERCLNSLKFLLKLNKKDGEFVNILSICHMQIAGCQLIEPNYLLYILNKCRFHASRYLKMAIKAILGTTRFTNVKSGNLIYS